ncbi:MAG: hypothetical protein Q7R33_10215 [Nitrosarchaeum sp.]|nr:hypothetical protein [Nitrosarchaeum sp.]
MENKIDAPDLLIVLKRNGKIGWDGVSGDCPENRSFAERLVRKMLPGSARVIRYVPVEIVAEKVK